MDTIGRINRLVTCAESLQSRQRKKSKLVFKTFEIWNTNECNVLLFFVRFGLFLDLHAKVSVQSNDTFKYLQAILLLWFVELSFFFFVRIFFSRHLLQSEAKYAMDFKTSSFFETLKFDLSFYMTYQKTFIFNGGFPEIL